MFFAKPKKFDALEATKKVGSGPPTAKSTGFHYHRDLFSLIFSGKNDQHAVRKWHRAVKTTGHMDTGSGILALKRWHGMILQEKLVVFLLKGLFLGNIASK